MAFYKSILRPLAFRLDPEVAHNLAMVAIKMGLVRSTLPQDDRLKRTLFGVEFPHPLGLAAGFDKNAVAIHRWHQLGFGFAEIGTVTEQAQPGQDKPRLFRLPTDEALINRMGFNNDGAKAIAKRLQSSQAKIPIGINIGKSKITPAENAAEDYQNSYRILHEFGDYFVINVSSPNTPGLRSLQSPRELQKIVSAIHEVDAKKPLFVKISPDLIDDEIDEICDFALESGLQGIIATNTTLSREGLHCDPNQSGGLSGGPLRTRSNEVLSRVAKRCDQKVAIIGVGGIMNGDDLYQKIQLGASLCQVYTGWVYGGPDFLHRCLDRYLTLSTR